MDFPTSEAATRIIVDMEVDFRVEDVGCSADDASRKRHLFLAGFGCVLVTVAFLLLWFNRFIGNGADTLWLALSHLMRQGEIPYRDFVLVVPPLQLLQTTAINWLFGDSLFYPRLIGVLQFALLSVVLYAWVLRFSKPLAAFIGTAVAMVVGFGDPGNVVSDYISAASFWCVCSGWLASSILQQEDRPSSRLAVLSGICAGMAVLERQTSGLAGAIAIGFLTAVLLQQSAGLSRALRFATAFAAGLLAPVAVLTGWLAAHSALASFIDQVFVRGVSSKGSLGAVFSRPFVGGFQDRYQILQFGAALAIVVTLAAVRHLFGGQSRAVTNTSVYVAAIAGTTLAVLSGTVLAQVSWSQRAIVLIHAFQITCVYISVLACVVVLAGQARLLVQGRLTPSSSQIGLFIGVGLAMAYANALSWMPFEDVVLPSLAGIIAIALTRLGSRVPARICSYGIWAGCLCTLACASTIRASQPFNWNVWKDGPVREATAISSLPALRHLKLTPATVHFVETVTTDIDTHSRPSDPIFTYPYLPAFYVLADRYPATAAKVHFMDVLPDFVAERDAATLLQNPPAVIVYAEETPDEFSTAEHAFGGSSRQGLLKLKQSLFRLVKEYRRVDQLTIPGSGRPVYVFVRPDR